MRLLHAVAFSKKLPWFESTNVISLKTQPHAVNACVKRSSQCSFKDVTSRVNFANCLNFPCLEEKCASFVVQLKLFVFLDHFVLDIKFCVLNVLIITIYNFVFICQRINAINEIMPQ